VQSATREQRDEDRVHLGTIVAADEEPVASFMESSP